MQVYKVRGGDTGWSVLVPAHFVRHLDVPASRALRAEGNGRCLSEWIAVAARYRRALAVCDLRNKEPALGLLELLVLRSLAADGLLVASE